LYQAWLALNFPIILLLAAENIYYWSYDNLLRGSPEDWARRGIGYVFYLYGCCQMLYAIRRKKSRIAQEAFLKFQYAFISSIAYLQAVLEVSFGSLPGNTQIKAVYIITFPIVPLVGGFFVLRVFKKNHPLTRLRGSQVSEDVNQDFLEQNQVIAAEFSKYDEQLNKWPYFIYKWLLKSSVIFELIFLFQYGLPNLSLLWRMSEEYRQFQGIDFFMDLFVIVWCTTSLLNAYSCFQSEIGLRTKNLAKTKRAIVLFKVGIVLAIIKCILNGKDEDLEDMIKSKTFLWFAGSIIVPIFGIVGALRAKKIIEERDEFVKVSSYSQDLYL